MAKTLLAVDDSVTMRKVLEITFSGEDFRVVTADSTQGALGKLSENPHVCVVDTVLGAEDGYALAKELRKRNPNASIIMLASRYAPYDQARGRDAGADDWADKPFDTQQLIDKVRKVVLAKEASAAAAPPPVPAAPAPQVPVGGATGYRPAGAGVGAQGLARTQPSAGAGASNRSGTLLFGEGGQAMAPPRPVVPAAPVAAPPPVPAAPPAPPVIGASAVTPTASSVTPGAGAVTPTAVAASAVVSGAVNGQLAGKLGNLGLTPQQADAVLALSREVVERIVWEVVPQLAETMIKEEIARLTKD